MYDLSWLNPTPHATVVYASCSALLPPHATLASRRPATALPGPDLHRLIAPALAGAFSLDHLISGRKQRRRHGKAEHFGGFDVDRQCEFVRLLHGQVTRLPTFKDAIDIPGSTTINVYIIR